MTNKKEELKTSGTECGTGCGSELKGADKRPQQENLTETGCGNGQGCGRAGSESGKIFKEWWKWRTDPNIYVKPGKLLGPVMEIRKKKFKRKKITSKGGNKDGNGQKITRFFEKLSQAKIGGELESVGVEKSFLTGRNSSNTSASGSGGGEVGTGSRVRVGGNGQGLHTVGIKRIGLQTVPATGGTVGEQSGRKFEVQLGQQEKLDK